MSEPPTLDSVLRGWLYESRERLPQFVIYDRPTDFPDMYVARLWWTLPEPQPTSFVIRSKGSESLRGIMENAGLTQLTRSPEDDPKIVETWL